MVEKLLRRFMKACKAQPTITVTCIAGAALGAIALRWACRNRTEFSSTHNEDFALHFTSEPQRSLKSLEVIEEEARRAKGEIECYITRGQSVPGMVGIRLDEELTKLLLRADTVKTYGDDAVASRRKSVIRSIHEVCRLLSHPASIESDRNVSIN